MKRSRLLLLLALIPVAVAATATFAAVTYAGFVKRSPLADEATIGVKRMLYLKTNGNENWNTGKFAIWVWAEGKSGAWADPDVLMTQVSTNVYRGPIPVGMQYAIFACFSEGDYPDWDHRKSQTVTITLSSLYDTFAITGEKTGYDYIVSPTSEHNSSVAVSSAA